MKKQPRWSSTEFRVTVLAAGLGVLASATAWAPIEAAPWPHQAADSPNTAHATASLYIDGIRLAATHRGSHPSVEIAGTQPTLPVKLWVATVDPDLSDYYAGIVGWNMSDALRRFDEEGTGVTFDFSTAHIKDPEKAALIQRTGQNILWTGDCSYYSDICDDETMYDPAQINVYYVDRLKGGKGLACLDTHPRIAFVRGIGFDFDTFAHELAHTLSLKHLNVEDAPDPNNPEIISQNVMCASDCERGNREHFTVGQAFRMHMNESSALNTMGIREGETTQCDTPGAKCPVVLETDPSKGPDFLPVTPTPEPPGYPYP